MSNKSFLHICGLLLVAIVAVHTAYATIDNNEIDDIPEYWMVQGVKVYPGNRECALVGGLCVHSNDCLSPTTTKGLCSSHASLGVECCYELPQRPAPCAEHFGECMDRCHKTLMRPGNDCESGKVCCVLV